ncbi:unnamed protein product [Allacma fusca]|uniref:Uncharacterized protein n=1 Tax=Allacma fusca TaxID=39272 RepID=A0A8J2PIH8_9HEXA|nr:unnamed protein product [Allacma fusca]
MSHSVPTNLEIRDAGAVKPITNNATAELVVVANTIVTTSSTGRHLICDAESTSKYRPPHVSSADNDATRNINTLQAVESTFIAEQATSAILPGIDGDIIQIGRGDPNLDESDMPPVWTSWPSPLRTAYRAVEQATSAIVPGIDSKVIQFGRGDPDLDERYLP